MPRLPLSPRPAPDPTGSPAVVASHSPVAPDAPDPHTALERPHGCGDLFWTFTGIALQGFGGVLAIIQRGLVERKRWLTRSQFLEDWAVAQVLPGPNVVNLALMIGDRHFGLRGALAATAGLLVFPTFVILALTVAHGQWGDEPRVAAALHGMALVASGLIIATALRMAPALKRHVIGQPLAALVATSVFGLVGLLQIPLALVLPVLGGASCLWTWHCLGRLPARPPSGGAAR